MARSFVAPPATGAPTLEVSPADALIDEARRIVLRGITPGARVTVRARTPRGHGVAWTSEAQFRADDQGVVDLGRQAPLQGSYTSADAMGLLWSQVPEVEGQRDVFLDDVTRPMVTELEAEVHADASAKPRGQGKHDSGGAARVRATLTQRLAAPGVVRREVREDGLVGTLFTPATPGPHPAVIVLNGSGGGINEPRAALYASHGYAALALAYFKAPGLSDYISNTPLEYFKWGLDWVHRTLQPWRGFVALSGQSRGGELVLLLATLFPREVSAVIAYVPSALVHGGQNAADPAVGRDGPAWLYEGKPLPHLWENNRSASWEPYDNGPQPRRNELAMRTALRDADAVARARIPVERIQGPVMLLSAGDDGSWPSSLFTSWVRDSLAAAGHPHDVQRRDYEGGGHSILLPHVPTTQLVYRHPVSGRSSTVGGSPSVNSHADADSWPAVRAFLHKAVQAHAKTRA
ncbi:acyl-CoA thioesterase/bile acid-CoA:amino acid N-acyltransferase family protein [Bordetella sp. N]|uniref:acyl-CoA thioesterase/bile acid-CoA:amino acid N-acyltransferase family protein n=1 Tax=Bordetella sp. N TaxID=1746199 RepID=UPI0007108534|nr:acyl-CoA thioesterase/bile acid-CoA:amino acid N-acyltransferase family protein [Bordetella sp. N]ALM86705.1 palmitoyl-CoA hydrolase [Bordetella sp. N]